MNERICLSAEGVSAVREPRSDNRKASYSFLCLESLVWAFDSQQSAENCYVSNECLHKWIKESMNKGIRNCKSKWWKFKSGEC